MLFSMNLAMLKMLSLFSHFGGRTLYIWKMHLKEVIEETKQLHCFE